jgi:hypothetical protein
MVRRHRRLGTGLLLTQGDDTQHIHLRLQLIRHWVRRHRVLVIDVVDYFLGASAFLSAAGAAGATGALFVASVLTASCFAFFSSFLAGAGAAGAGAEAVAAGAGVAGALAGSAANAEAANNVAIKADTSFMDISLG